MAGNYFLAQFSAIGKMFYLLYKMTVICTFQRNRKKNNSNIHSTTEKKFPNNYRVVVDGQKAKGMEIEAEVRGGILKI